MPFGCGSVRDGGGFRALRIKRQGVLQVGRGKAGGNGAGDEGHGERDHLVNGLMESELWPRSGGGGCEGFQSPDLGDEFSRDAGVWERLMTVRSARRHGESGANSDAHNLSQLLQLRAMM